MSFAILAAISTRYHALRKIAGTIAISLFLLFFGAQVALAQIALGTITVEGNTRVSEENVIALSRLSAGQTASAAQINRALQNLYDSGLFEQVDIFERGEGILISVLENPTINRVAIEGNRRLGDEVLLPLINSQPRRTFSVSQTEQDVKAIVQAYVASGRIAAEVQPIIIRRSDNRVDLVFEVLEGRVTEVNDISFIGNGAYSDSRLRQVLQTKQANAFSGLFANDTFLDDRLIFDTQKLTEFYANRGYIDFEVTSSSAVLSRERDAFSLKFNVIEGQRYRFGEITLSTDVDVPNLSVFEGIIQGFEGDNFDPRVIERMLEQLDREADRQGLSFVRARPNVTRDKDARRVMIEIALIRGSRSFVERIDIEGNSITLDRVIRRQFATAEGDVFNRREIQEATDRIRALGYFNAVEVDAREGSGPEQAVIDVNVVEASTGNFSLGAAYSNGSGIAGDLSIVERNFIGRGQTVGLSLRTAKNEQNFDVQFVEPSVLDRDLSFEFSGNYGQSSAGSLPVETDGTSLRVALGYPVSDVGRIRAGLRHKSFTQKVATQEDPDTGDTTALTSSDFFLAEDGRYESLSIFVDYSVDRTNSPVNPTAGSIQRYRQEVGGLLGGQKFIKSTASFKTYRATANEQLVFSFEIEGGAVFALSGSTIPVRERFHLGGDVLRGFENFGAGPRDDGYALGGQNFVVGRAEVSFPLGIPEELGIYGGLFFDIGSVWGLQNDTIGGQTVDDGLTLRSAAGFSLFWETALGPLRFNFSRTIRKERFDKKENFRFTIESRF